MIGNLTPQEKAKEIFEKFIDLADYKIGDYETEKEMSIYLVDEILNITISLNDFIDDFKYWQQVKEELLKM